MNVPSELKEKFKNMTKNKNYSDEQKRTIIDLMKLIRKYSENVNEYKMSKEAQIRNELIDPFFESFGWDMKNKSGYSDEYKDVIIEDTVLVKGKKKAPDYSFCIGGRRIFYVEAKKPAVNLKKDISPSYQIKRYAWSSQKSISILTDFEEFAVYDCTKKPNPKDNASVGRIFYCTFNDYLDNFEKIWNIISKESIKRGKFDKLTESLKDRKGTNEVDHVFLKDMELWREKLAKNIIQHNKELNEIELNYCVQKTIERILFLRICEDRGVELYEDLKEITKEKEIYKELCKKYDKADDKYNSGLFDFEADKLSKKIHIDNRTLNNIINGLYYPESPYDFSALNVEILGSAYERFLGNIVRFTKQKGVKIEEKLDIKRAGGVFYTPNFVVDNIVTNTVGKVIQNKTPEQIEGLKILDPACGSGTFLVSAYTHLLRYHLNYYTKDLKKFKKYLYQSRGGNYFLKTEIRKKILINNIFGIDVDYQAVEITKLSLLLKVLENENIDPSQYQKKLHYQKVLPNLKDNIRCGNSLIDFDVRNTLDSNIEFKSEINPFDWSDTKMGFGSIMETGGFDVIIGNPPYVRVQTINKMQARYFKANFETAKMAFDMYMIFVENGFKKLNKNGMLSYIIPDKFIIGKSGINLRTFIAKHKSLRRIIHFKRSGIFKNAEIDTCIIIIGKNTQNYLEYKKFVKNENFRNLKNINYEKINLTNITNDNWNFNDDEITDVMEKIINHKDKFENITEKIFKGFSTGNEDIFVLKFIKNTNGIATMYSKYNNEVVKIEMDLLRPFLTGKDVRRYIPNKTSKMVLLPYKKNSKGKMELLKINDLKVNYPNSYNYLNNAKKKLLTRKGKFTNINFYKYSAERSMSDYEQIKIIIPDILVSNRVGFDYEGVFYHNAIHSVIFKNEYKKRDPLFYLGILNSDVFWFFIKNTSPVLGGSRYRLTPQYLDGFCFPFLCEKNMQIYEQIIFKVSEIMKLKQKINDIKTEYEINSIENEIRSLEKNINQNVFQIYGFNEKDIKLIQENVKKHIK